MVPSFEYDDDDQTTSKYFAPKHKHKHKDGCWPNTSMLSQIQVQKPKYKDEKASLFIDRYPKYRSVFAYYMSAPHLKLPNTVPHQINELSE